MTLNNAKFLPPPVNVAPGGPSKAARPFYFISMFYNRRYIIIFAEFIKSNCKNMYKIKPCKSCNMPFPEAKLKALVLNASLKHEPEISNTGELSELVIKHMGQLNVESEIIRLSDKNIPVGLNYREGKNDDWPGIAKKIRETDIFIMATPIWWGGRSSLMQRIIERLDAFDEEYHKGGRSA
jgi:hypothetical protein